MKTFATIYLTCLAFVVLVLVGVVMVALVQELFPVKTPEPCVEVGKLDGDRVVIVCDEEAALRWTDPPRNSP
jgi:hypothetical protein